MLNKLVLAAALTLAACATPGPSTLSATAPAEQREPVTILVGIDGFRPDYLTRGVTPVLSRLAAEGVSGPMRPSFPSKTYPNFWTLVTGLVPDHHGIVANRMEDATRPGEVFTMATDDPFWWNGAEPIWVTAERAGVRTATEFWPGASVGWGGTRRAGSGWAVDNGTRPRDWHHFNQSISSRERVGSVVDWLRRPTDMRPRFVTLYFDEVDTAGHEVGPDGAALNAAVADVDAQVGRLLAELKGLGQPVNLVIVADHGMAATSSERVVDLSQVVPTGVGRLVEYGPYASFVAQPGRDVDLARALLRPHPHMRCWRKGDLPARLRYGTHPRVPPYLCLGAVGWELLPKRPDRPFSRGNHGYDNAAPEMQALFIAQGPAFRQGVTLPSFDNTSVAPLLRRLIRLPDGLRLDGSAKPFDGALR